MSIEYNAELAKELDALDAEVEQLNELYGKYLTISGLPESLRVDMEQRKQQVTQAYDAINERYKDMRQITDWEDEIAALEDEVGKRIRRIMEMGQ